MYRLRFIVLFLIVFLFWFCSNYIMVSDLCLWASEGRFEDFSDHVGGDLAGFSKLGHALLSEGFEDGVDGCFIEAVVSKAGCRSEVFEVLSGFVDGEFDADAVFSISDVPDSGGVLEEFFFLFAPEYGPDCGDQDGEGPAMGDCVEGCELVADHVGAPVLGDAGS